ncbi:hypothetical protein HPB48_001085 [Haemaphysalis longicornis]|uniref:Uncharacterized protein n=1 Tax=Haemaphysalis longicornis TaxID=44386 RepID=A0A9J6GDF6_HAELO|nr:hypothetical protein HPB48_001085 [Haemaphysalis longicornis]
MKYVPDSAFKRLAECSSLYYLRTTCGELGTTLQGIRVFIRNVAMLKFPRVGMYWQKRTRIAVVADTMNVRTTFHVTDASAPAPDNTDKFWKLRPLIDVVRA